MESFEQLYDVQCRWSLPKPVRQLSKWMFSTSNWHGISLIMVRAKSPTYSVWYWFVGTSVVCIYSWWPSEYSIIFLSFCLSSYECRMIQCLLLVRLNTKKWLSKMRRNDKNKLDVWTCIPFTVISFIRSIIIVWLVLGVQCYFFLHSIPFFVYCVAVQSFYDYLSVTKTIWSNPLYEHFELRKKIRSVG